jgi:sensor histidine kinase YesM
MKSISIPVINTLKSADAVAIREITLSLIVEIQELNKRFDDMEEARKKASESNQRQQRKGAYNGV